MKTSIIITAFLVSVASATATTTPAALLSKQHPQLRQPQDQSTSSYLNYLDPVIMELPDDDNTLTTAATTATSTPSASKNDDHDDDDDNYLDPDEIKSKSLTPVTKPAATKTAKRKSYTSNGSVCVVEAKATKCHKIPNINKTGVPKERIKTVTTTVTATPTNGAERNSGNDVLLGAAAAVAGFFFGL